MNGPTHGRSQASYQPTPHKHYKHCRSVANRTLPQLLCTLARTKGHGTGMQRMYTETSAQAIHRLGDRCSQMISFPGMFFHVYGLWKSALFCVFVESQACMQRDAFLLQAVAIQNGTRYNVTRFPAHLDFHSAAITITGGWAVFLRHSETCCSDKD